MKTQIEYLTEAKKVQLLLLELICAIEANANAHDDDLEDTWENLEGKYLESKKALFEYLEELK